MLLTKPSFYALVFTGFIILVILIISIYNINQFKNLTFHMSLKIISLIGILIGIHGLQHLGLEVAYNYNPLESKY